jgi:hypothetical protein
VPPPVRQAPAPPRPIYREPGPVGGGTVLAGLIGGGLWMTLFGLLANTTGGYAWISVVAGGLAWAVAVLLGRVGDRGAAVGIAISTGVALAITATVVVAAWATSGWPMW